MKVTTTIPFASVIGLALNTGYANGYSFFFNNTDFDGQTQNLSAGCSVAMQAPLSCDPTLLHVMMSNFYGMLGNATVQDRFCADSCRADLIQYKKNVSSSCQGDPQPLPGYPATYWGNVALSAFTTVCLKDATAGHYCAETIAGFFNGSVTDGDGTDLPRDKLCSNCVVSLFRQIQGTPYSNYDQTLAGVWGSIQGICGLQFPTEVQPLETNVTTPGGYAEPGSASTGCLSGKTYTVVAGDTCEIIARRASVSTGTLMAINSIYPDCSNLFAGATLCLPELCTALIVPSGATCDSIGAARSTDFQRLVAWNPALNAYCSNLIADQNICISPPGGVANYSTIPSATVTRTAAYATATVSRPDPVASGTTKNCGKYYQVQTGDYCQLVALNQTIALDLFLAINPSINSTCGNLMKGVYYCTWPTLNWNATTTSTTAAPPAPTPTGSTPNCYEWYVVQSGDYCAKIENQFDISFEQFVAWNPSIDPTCSNLLLGDAYCVNGATQASLARFSTTTMAAPGEARRTAQAAAADGGVPYGWPGLVARVYWGGVSGRALVGDGL